VPDNVTLAFLSKFVPAAALGEAALAGAIWTHSSVVTVVLPIAVVIVAGFFTLRSNVAKIWRDNYEAKVEENKVLSVDLHASKQHTAALEAELSQAKAQLTIEQAKTDLSPIVEQLNRQYDLLGQILTATKERPHT
jgi:hypothetical protein